MTDREKLMKLLEEALDYSRMCREIKRFTGHEEENPYKTAADYLIEHGVTVQRWIPVTERLPEESGEYLAYCGEYDGICVIYYEILKTKSKWRTNWKEVTHWMPLPEAPKED